MNLELLPDVPLCERERAMLTRLCSGTVVKRAAFVDLCPTDASLGLAVHRLRRKLPRGVSVVTHRGLGFSLVDRRRSQRATA